MLAGKPSLHSLEKALGNSVEANSKNTRNRVALFCTDFGQSVFPVCPSFRGRALWTHPECAHRLVKNLQGTLVGAKVHRNFVANFKRIDYFAGLAADQMPSREVHEQLVSAHLPKIDHGHLV